MGNKTTKQQKLKITAQRKLKEYVKLIHDFSKNRYKCKENQVTEVDLLRVNIKRLSCVKLEVESSNVVRKVNAMSFKIENEQLKNVFDHFVCFKLEMKDFFFNFTNDVVDKNVTEFLTHFIKIVENRIVLESVKSSHFVLLHQLGKRIETQKELFYLLDENELCIKKLKSDDVTVLSCKKKKLPQMIKFSRAYFHGVYETSFQVLTKLHLRIKEYDEITKLLTDRNCTAIDLKISFLKVKESSFISLLQKRVSKFRSFEIFIILEREHIHQPNILKCFTNALTAAALNDGECYLIPINHSDGMLKVFNKGLDLSIFVKAYN